MQHFVAYGNSDQATFRDPEVASAIDFLTVPGTVAAYYPDATAAFVLSSGYRYVIDVRTPLFQGNLATPRASHYVLGSWLGSAVRDRMGDQTGSPVVFGHDLYEDEIVLNELVDLVLKAQREYGGRAEAIADKLGRYGRLLAEARGEAPPESTAVGQAPEFILAPYFAASGPDDSWWSIDQRIWERCAGAPDATRISAVVAVTSPSVLAPAIASVPPELAGTTFFWVTGFDERRAADVDLEIVGRAVQQSTGRQLVNLYGGFYSIMLAYVGLWGFNNGLGYSETRAWPELAATGAAPARYYVRRLHAFASPAVAQLVVQTDPWFACECPVCSVGGIAALQYGDLKRHFAWSRAREITDVSQTSPSITAAGLEEAAARVSTHLESVLPQRLVPDTRHLGAWARAIRRLTD
jgi:hypothetical protein